MYMCDRMTALQEKGILDVVTQAFIKARHIPVIGKYPPQNKTDGILLGSGYIMNIEYTRIQLYTCRSVG